MKRRRDPRLVESYDYTLPQELIAHAPVSPRERARMLVYDRENDTVTHTTVAALPDLLPPSCHILLNDTKVIKARLFGRKESGGRIELLLNRPLEHDERFQVYIRGRVREHSRLYFDHGLEAEVCALHPDGTREVRFFLEHRPIGFEALHEILERIGHVPLPPYIKRPDTTSDARDYQTLFAREAGAVAAPTASLHLGPTLFETLQERFALHYLTLHVGAGTFKPVKSSDIEDHVMHRERYMIPPETARILRSDAKLLAVGTTVTRTVEYFIRTGRRFGESDLFLHPLNPPRRINYLMTNFHLPKSTLLMLVASFIGLEKTLALYEEAIKERYRFFSYGDAMLIL